MYYGSGTAAHTGSLRRHKRSAASAQPADATAYAWSPSWKYYVTSKTPLRRRLMRIYLKNSSAKFHPDPIWNDETLVFFEMRWPQQEQQDE